MFYSSINTKLCRIFLIGDDKALRYLHLDTENSKKKFECHPDWVLNRNLFDGIERQIHEYMEGKRERFDVAIHPEGTVFQKRVWQALREIPYGELRSYGDIAKAVGNPKAARAVGAANGKNPIPLIIPCHRVVGSDGSMTGFGSGIDIKKKLIQLERIHFLNDGEMR